MRRYFACIAIGNLLWEIAHFPLYAPLRSACLRQATHDGRWRVSRGWRFKLRKAMGRASRPTHVRDISDRLLSWNA